jgi:hypothetical protein
MLNFYIRDNTDGEELQPSSIAAIAFAIAVLPPVVIAVPMIM